MAFTANVTRNVPNRIGDRKLVYGTYVNNGG